MANAYHLRDTALMKYFHDRTTDDIDSPEQQHAPEVVFPKPKKKNS